MMDSKKVELVQVAKAALESAGIEAKVVAGYRWALVIQMHDYTKNALASRIVSDATGLDNKQIFIAN